MYGNPGNIVGWHIELCANAQNNRLGGETDYSLQLEDSDGVTSSDYYSGKVAVRTHLDVYDLFYGKFSVCLSNSQNKLVGIGGRLKYEPVDKRNGNPVDLDLTRVLTFDPSTVNSIVKEVFPNCEVTLLLMR